MPSTAVIAQLTTANFSGGNGWAAAYGCDDGYHGTSSVNNINSPIASNLVIVPTDARGDFCVQSSAPTDIVVDVIGAIDGADLTEPKRYYDTREICYAARSPSPDDPRPVSCTPNATKYSDLDLQIYASAARVGATLILQVTTDGYENNGNGWTAVFDCVAGYQGTSSLNNTDSPIASNLVIAPQRDNSDRVCLRSQALSHFIVDYIGTLPESSSIHAPVRVLDTRLAAQPNTDFVVDTALPNADVVLQVTTDHYSTGRGYTAVFDCTVGYNGTSSLNNTGHAIASGLVIAHTDQTGRVCVRSQHSTDLVVDVLGTVGDAHLSAPKRVLDTR